MKITKIAQQVKRVDRYSVFVDDKYAFSLSESALLESRLARGQELNEEQIAHYKELSADDKLYQQTLRYMAMRPRTQWEIEQYLQRKHSPAPLIEQITNKLVKVGLINDAQWAAAFVHDRLLFRPTSRRKIILELKKKHVPESVIEAVFEEATVDEPALLHQVIAKKRRQLKYQDNLKLMQYLARQGFRYDDIKNALQTVDD